MSGDGRKSGGGRRTITADEGRLWNAQRAASIGSGAAAHPLLSTD
jgi:hypothetical protein